MENENKIEKILYPDIAKQIKDMYEKDQSMRKKGLEDANFFDHGLDVDNTQTMKGIIAQIGWPTVSKVGAQGAEKAWLLVQHADDEVLFQNNVFYL